MTSYSRSKHALTPNELRLLSLAADGYQPCEIADRMSTNVYRVKDHIYQVIVKLGVRSLEEAVVSHYKRLPTRPDRVEVEAVR